MKNMWFWRSRMLLTLATPVSAARGGERGPDPLGNIHCDYTA
jgi:hypothetical protein